jgi:hypothetical protein
MAEHRDDERGNDRRPPGPHSGYDDTARGDRGIPSSNAGTTPDQHRGPEDAFDREAREAATDVRRRDSSAD